MEYPELPEPLEIDWPEMHSQALGCGVEDRGLRDRYECAEYGWQDGVDRAAQCVPDQIFDADQMRAYVNADRVMRAGWQPIESAPKDGTSVLIYTNSGIIEAVFGYNKWEQQPCYATYDGIGGVELECQPTHWMPLPPPPEE